MRRGFGRRMRRGRDVPPLLRQAHHLLGAGEYAPAAEAFEQLAEISEMRLGPRAPMFFLQAGRARLLAGEVPLALEHLRQAFQLFAERGQWARLQRAGQRSMAELRQLGFEAEAKQVYDSLGGLLPQGFGLSMAPALRQRPLLPTHCPACGAVVVPYEVEWIDDSTAECDYCGSPLRAQTK